MFDDVNLHIERGDRIALVGPNGAGKSTLMRMLSGVEAPDAGTRTEGHQVVMQYFAQDEATRLDPDADRLPDARRRLADPHGARTSATSSAASCSRATTSTSRCGVLSGGERTRLAVARMLLRPSNTLLLDEPTNHLDLDSKDVLLEALEDFGGTLIFVSHDRYFVDKLATQGHRDRPRRRARLSRAPTRSSSGARSSASRGADGRRARRGEAAQRPGCEPQAAEPTAAAEPPAQAADRRAAVAARRRRRRRRSRPTTTQEASEAERTAGDARTPRRDSGASQDLEARIAEREQAIKELEAHDGGARVLRQPRRRQAVIDRHQALMWEVGDLMHQWEALQTEQNCNHWSDL